MHNVDSWKDLAEPVTGLVPFFAVYYILDQA